jgi:glyoxylate reductase
MKVAFTRKIPDIAENLLKQEGYEVVVFESDKPIDKKQLIKIGKDADAIISLLTDKIDKEIIDSLEKCKVIANYAVGFNNIDVEYAKSKGIVVTNTPDILTDSTADLAAGLVLACCRNFHTGEKMMRNREFTGWKPQLLLGIQLSGKRVGIIGAGRIGQATAKRLKAFGTEIVYYNRSRKEQFEKETGAQKVEINELLKTSDIISLHLPLNEETHHLLNKERLALLKPKAVLVNTARGEAVDEKALIELLKEKKIFAAGFDVYEGEPNVNEQLYDLDNVFILPHLGSATFEARGEMAELCAQNVIKVLSGESPLTSV